MSSRKNPVLSAVLGWLSVAGLIFLWTIELLPVKWNVRYPGDGLGTGLTLFFCAVMLFLAARKGSPWWYVVAVAGILTLVYVGFFIQSPDWS
jgi:hypothetical protein